MPAILSPNPKKISIYIDKYGNKYEGNYFQNAEKTFGGNLGGNRTPEGVATPPRGDTEKKEE